MIPNVIKGQVPTFLDTDFANDAIDQLNKIENIQINYGQGFKVTQGADKIDISIPRPPDPIAVTGITGGTLSAETYSMFVCENGYPVVKNFLVSP
jgi:hypothetical protein